MYYEGVDISGFAGCSTTEDGKYPLGSKTEGWGVYLKEGQDYHYLINHNKKIQSGEYLNKEDYPNIEEDSFLLEEFSEEELEESKTQYHPAWCCVKYKDEDDLLFIDLHY